MLEKLNLCDDDLMNFKNFKIGYGKESNVYYYNDNGETKVIKIFNKNINCENKLKKISLIKERTKKYDFVVTADKLVYHNNNFIGYSMPEIKGNEFDILNSNLYENITILKDLSKKLKILHELGIVCADFQHNMIIDKNGKVYLIDTDNFIIDNFNVDTKNTFLRDIYMPIVKRIDKNFDNYLLNLLTITTITKIDMKYLSSQYIITPHLFNFKDDKINEIVKNTLQLKKIYNEDLIIDHINSKKELKKIRRKLF